MQSFVYPLHVCVNIRAYDYVCVYTSACLFIYCMCLCVGVCVWLLGLEPTDLASSRSAQHR